MIVGKFSNTLLFFCSFIDVVFACAASHVCTHCVWYSCCACGAQLRIEADQPLTFSDQHSPRLSALAQAIMETLFWFLGCDKIMTGGWCFGWFGHFDAFLFHPVLQLRESPPLLCVLFCFSIPCVCDYVFVHVSCENYHLRMRTCHEWHAYIYVA